MEGEEGPSAPIRQSITYSRVVDLSHVIHPGMASWPGDPPVEFREVAQLDRDGYFMRRFSMGEHSATHMNAPNTYYPGGASIDAYPVESMVAPAVVIDVRDRTTTGQDYALSRADVLAWEEQHNQIQAGTIVLLYTGWQSKWADPRSYLGGSGPEGLHFPGFGHDAARLLIADRGVAGLGIDTHGLEPGQDTDYTVNKLVLNQPRVALENLTNLDQLPPTGITLVIGVLRLKGGSGAPVSVLAFVE